jgi:lysophospholipase L1-like esterase
MPTFPVQTALAASTFAVILLGVHYGLDPRRGLDPATLRPVADFRFDRASFVPILPVPLPPVPEVFAIPSPSAPGWTEAGAANLTLESPYLYDDAGVLDHFYNGLRALSSPHARTVRIVHYGDSPTTADLITGDARELLQQRFGNAGPGFILIAKPWAWYGHHGVEVDASSNWKIDTAVGSMREAAYGLGGAIFTGPPGATSTLRLDAADSTSVELEFLQSPGAGSVEIAADGETVATVATAGETRQNGAASVALPPGTKQVRLTVKGSPVQIFGVAFGRAAKDGTPGLTYDSIGLNGASTTVMSRAFSPENWTGALQHRNPDLVIINYGTNESSFPAYVDKQYEPELRRAIARVRTALPDASILIMSPMDRGAHGAGDTITTMPAIPAIVAIQRRVAHELHCGFFNTYEAMGGDGTMAKWYGGHPRMVAADLIHPTPQGARIVAQLLTGQLLIGYERYRQRIAPHPASLAANQHPASPNAPRAGVH